MYSSDDNYSALAPWADETDELPLIADDHVGLLVRRPSEPRGALYHTMLCYAILYYVLLYYIYIHIYYTIL